MNHRDVKRAHEAAIITDFVTSFNAAFGTEYVIDSVPEPPDALLRSDNGVLWIEHSDVYRSKEEAIEEMSYAIGKPRHVRTEHPIVSPDQRIASAVLERISDKFGKVSYQPMFQQYGCGYLLLDTRDPLFSESTLRAIESSLDGFHPRNDKCHFSKVFLTFRLSGDCGNRYKEIYSRKSK